MQNRATALAVGAFVTLNVFVASALVGARPAAGGPDGKEVREQNLDANGTIRVHEQGTAQSLVTNFPLDENGRLKTSGNAVVSGTVAATQSGPWTVGLDGAAAADLNNIAAATSGLRYDASGNLQVSVAGGGSGSDPSVAHRAPFGTSVGSSIAGGTTVTIAAAPAPAKVTAYSFHTDHDVLVMFLEGGSPVLAVRVLAGQVATASFHHAILAESMTIRCFGGDACAVTSSVAGY